MMEKQYAFLCFNTAFVFHKKNMKYIFNISFQSIYQELINYNLQVFFLQYFTNLIRFCNPVPSAATRKPGCSTTCSCLFFHHVVSLGTKWNFKERTKKTEHISLFL